MAWILVLSILGGGTISSNFKTELECIQTRDKVIKTLAIYDNKKSYCYRIE